MSRTYFSYICLVHICRSNKGSHQEFADPQCEELYQHDYVIWSGDLNYRVAFDNLETRKMVADGRHLELVQYDQLKSQQKEGLAFVGFEEGEITFPPSYKFDMGR